jgi:tetratricopeptide (TPR) repeat protein
MLYAAWTVGNRVAMEATIGEMQRLVELWHLQLFSSLVVAFEVTLALAKGRFAEGEQLIERAFRLGERAQSWNASTTYRLQTFTLRSHLDRLDGYEEVLRRSLDDYPGYLIFDCALARAYAQLGRREECSEIYERLAEGGFAGLSRDGDWLVNMCLLSEVCSYLGEHGRPAVLIDLLVPFADLHAVAAGEIAAGAVAHHVGRLEGELGRHDEAEAHFETALQMNADMGARPWLAHTQTDYARMLLARGSRGDGVRADDLLSRARAAYDELGMQGAARRAKLLAGRERSPR